ncbi:uncharacterized protein FYW47_000635 [Aplochiton taeniatus]
MTVDAMASRGDDIWTTPHPPKPETAQDQVLVFPSVGPAPETAPEETTEAAGVGEHGPALPTAPENVLVVVVVVTEEPQVGESEPPNPEPPRGDGGGHVIVPKPVSDVICVTKGAVQDRDAVSLKLTALSNCEQTRQKIQSVLDDLCGEDCKLEVFQEDNTNEILITGPYIQADTEGMAMKFNNDNIKDKMGVEEAVPRWGKKSKMVLVSLLLTGLLLAALMVAGYYLKTHRGKNAKGVRLADSFQVDEENQANTLVSVAPLHPQEALDKPVINGESPPESGSQPAPPNGPPAPQTPVADTQM